MSRPNHVAILGAGPVGLDAALALAERGVPFTLYETGTAVAEHVRSWAHVEMFSPWALDVSPRMARALAAAGQQVPDDPHRCPTGGELVDRVLAPVAGLPQIAGSLETHSRVVAVGRHGLLKHEQIANQVRAARPFRLLVQSSDGSARERVDSAAVVFDCTGSYGHPNAVGDGGIPAPGEVSCGDQIDHHIPSPTEIAERYAGRHVLLLGAGHSAQTAASDLAAQAERDRTTRVVWAVRQSEPAWGSPVDDPLPIRAALAARARALFAGASPAVEMRRGVVVESFAKEQGRMRVELRQDDGRRETLVVDRVLALTGGVGDHSIYRQLQVHECYATGAPMKLAAALLGAAAGGDCLAGGSHGAATLVNPEPGFFILGAKSYGRTSTFLLKTGWQQVDDVMSLLGI